MPVDGPNGHALDAELKPQFLQQGERSCPRTSSTSRAVANARQSPELHAVVGQYYPTSRRRSDNLVPRRGSRCGCRNRISRSASASRFGRPRAKPGLTFKSLGDIVLRLARGVQGAKDPETMPRRTRTIVRSQRSRPRAPEHPSSRAVLSREVSSRRLVVRALELNTSRHATACAVVTRDLERRRDQQTYPLSFDVIRAFRHPVLPTSGVQGPYRPHRRVPRDWRGPRCSPDRRSYVRWRSCTASERVAYCRPASHRPGGRPDQAMVEGISRARWDARRGWTAAWPRGPQAPANGGRAGRGSRQERADDRERALKIKHREMTSR